MATTRTRPATPSLAPTNNGASNKPRPVGFAASTRSPRIEVLAAGAGPISSGEASYAARHVIREMYVEDLLKEHRPQPLKPDLVAQADLILVMGRSLLLTPGKTHPPNKAFVLKEFCGLQGDVVDP